MNKTLAIIVAFMLSILMVESALGQGVTKGLTAKGIKAGVNLAKLTGSNVKDAKMLLGIVGGAFVEYSVSPMFAIQPELLYSMEGMKQKDIVEEGITVTPKWTLSYLQIPVFLKVKPQASGNIKPTIFAGPFFGILMSAKATASASLGGQSADVSVDVKDFFESTNIGVAFGVGAACKLTKGEITFDARYALGLSKIDKAEEGTTPNAKTATFSFLVGYGF
ncbi:MAG: porin family protein [candidate division Zixibacteria bacterium]|nr:porin family protein [candidate division Zixibacteria bacterium]